MSHIDSVDEICRIPNPLDCTSTARDLMVRACRDAAHHHRGRCPVIAEIFLRHRFDPDSIRTDADLARIPTIGVTAMKYHLLLSGREEDAVLKLTSSGTRGQKTQIWFDQASLDRVQNMMEVLWRQERLVSEKPTNYLMFSYDPKDADDLGIAFTNRNLQRFAPVAESFFAIRKNSSGQWEFRKEETLETLRSFSAAGLPVRILGMPLFIWDLLETIGTSEKIPLPPGSLAVTGGGWKTAEDRKVSKEVFREKIHSIFDIEPRWVRDNYGMAEHSAPYIECSHHRFHVPVYNRLYVRDPVDMRVLDPGQPGLLELITPYNLYMPNLALLSTDVGFVDPDACGCGAAAPSFTLVGRAGLSRHKGCAIHASEIVRRAGSAPAAGGSR